MCNIRTGWQAVTVTLLPDIERLVTTFLRAQSEVSSLVASRVFTEVSPNPTFPLVRVRRVGGFPTLSHPLYIDAPLVQIEGYAATKGAARLLTETCRAVLAERVEGVHATGVVAGATFGALLWLPDDDFTPPKPRYVTDATLTVRPL